MNKLELNSLITINKKNKKKINKHISHTQQCRSIKLLFL